MNKDNGWKNERAIYPNFSLQNFLEKKKKKKTKSFAPISFHQKKIIFHKKSAHENHCDFTTPLHEISL